MTITTFLFDLDGVLVDLCELHRKIFIKVFNDNNYVSIDSDFHDKFLEGLSTREKLKKIKTQLCIEIDEDLIYKKKQEYTLYELHNYPFTSRIKNVLEWVKNQGIRIGVFTNSIRNTLDIVLKKLDILHLIEYSLSNEDVQKPKPSPSGYLKLMEIMNVTPSETLIFEDSLCGRTAAYESGAHVIPIVNSLDITVSFLDHCRIYLKRPLSLSTLRIVIPMAGLGSRFQKDDYIIQKPFLPMIGGRQLWEEVVENLLPKEKDVREKTDVHLIVRKDQMHLFKNKPNLYIHTVETLTEGPACTVLTLKNIINDDTPLIIGNSDQYLEWNSDEFLSTSLHPDYDGCISTFYHPCPDDLKWSYTSLCQDDMVKEVAEKKYIGPYATTGIYAWKKGSDYVKYAEKMIVYNDRVNNEFYVCPVYNYAIKDNKKIRILNCLKFWGVGIPKDYIDFIDNHKNLSLYEKYESLWCKWGSRLPLCQPDFSSDKSICAAMWCKGLFRMTRALKDFQTALSDWNTKLIWYDINESNDAILHHTFFQFHTFGIKQYEKQDYIPLIKQWSLKARDEMKDLPPYYLCFNGIAPSRTGIVLCGYPPTDYNGVRQKIRNVYPCSEPHSQDIYHVTLARWVKPLDEHEFSQITQIMKIFQHSYFGMLQPSEWNAGFSTWCMKENTLDIIEKWNTVPSPWILHRGNSEGPSKTLDTENNPSILYKLIKEGWDVEIDVWKIKDKLYLGHDSPQTLIDLNEPLLSSPRTWIHCKNLDAYFYFRDHPSTSSFHFFSNDKDDIAVTSKGIIWGNIDIELNSTGSIKVINTKSFNVKAGVGICIDWKPTF